MRVHFDVLGCKLNEAEVERWMREFSAAGYQVVFSPEEAELCIVHSCTVTNTASRKSRQTASRGHRRGQIVVLSGCYAELVRQRGDKLPGIDLVVGTADTPRLLEVLRENDLLPRFPSQAHSATTGRTRAFLKVQDGCNMRCAFCIIPFTRGPERSRALPEVVAETQELVAAGYQEVVITGVQISAYRGASSRLPDLVGALLSETDVPRVRLTSIAPWEVDEGLLGLWQDPRLCRHLHVSLQSGCDATLRRMRRPYSTERFASAVDLARRRVPGVGITTDVIVGFPGESEAEFAESLAFVSRADFTRLHVFPYSPRPGTAGAAMAGQVPEPAKKERAKAMQAAGEAGARRFAARFVGEKLSVLFESRNEGAWEGYSDNYLRVRAEVDSGGARLEPDLHNRVCPTEVVGVASEGVWGRIL